MIIGGTFPASVPSYFAEVYKELDRMFRRQLVAVELSKLNGEISGLKTWVKIDYKNLKKVAGADDQRLTAALEPKVSELAIKVLGVLQADPFREPGLPTFLIAAGLHLALLQELALVDPSAERPEASPHYQSVREYAAEYAEQARSLGDKIVTAREAYFKVHYDSEVV